MDTLAKGEREAHAPHPQPLSHTSRLTLSLPRCGTHSLRGDVLLNLASLDGLFFKLLRLAFGLSVCCTYPTMHYVVRRSVDQMLFHSSEGLCPLPASPPHPATLTPSP